MIIQRLNTIRCKGMELRPIGRKISLVCYSVISIVFYRITYLLSFSQRISRASSFCSEDSDTISFYASF